MNKDQEQEHYSEWMEEEICRQLKALSVEDLQDEDSAEDEIDVLLEPEPDVDLLPSLVDYMSRVQSQIRNFENELDECDILLHESDVVSARQHSEVRDYLEPEARKLGLDVDTLKEKVFRELEEGENEVILTVTQGEDEKGCGMTDHVTETPLGDEQCPTTLSIDIRPCSNQQSLSADQSANSFVESTGILAVASNSGDCELDTDAPVPTTTVDNGTFRLKPEEGIVSEILESDVLERQSLQRLLELDVRQREKEEQRLKEIENRKTQQKLQEESIAKKRSQKHEELEQEKQKIAKQKQEYEHLLKKEEKEQQMKLEISLKDHEEEINQLAAETRKQQEDFQKAMAEAKERQCEKETTAATKIQASYKGYRVRKAHSQALKEKLSTLKIQREEEQIKQIQLVIKMREEEERKRKEVESRRMMEEKQNEEQKIREVQRKREEELQKQKEEKQQEEQKIREVQRKKELQKQKEEKQRREEQKKREEMERNIKEKKDKEIKEELSKQRLQDETLKEELRKKEHDKSIEEDRGKQDENADCKQRETDVKNDDQKTHPENCKTELKFDQEENKKVYSEDIVEKKRETEHLSTTKKKKVPTATLR